MNKRALIQKMLRDNRHVDAKMIHDALAAVNLVRTLRLRRKRKRGGRRFDPDSPFTTSRPDGTMSDPRAVYF
jgi:hypothetical protein